MVGVTGFEPATFWSRTKRATKLRYTPSGGANEETRTPDLLITNQLLYRLSYSSELGYFNTEHLKCQAKRDTSKRSEYRGPES